VDGRIRRAARRSWTYGQPRSLREVIDADKAALLGDKVATFGELPFLFKVLCAAQPLSIQVHPNKQASEDRFRQRERRRHPASAAERNYKDPNHKPELVFALTPFLAMNAFREFSEIVTLLQPVAMRIRRSAPSCSSRTRLI
jgi:mannose-6-phosphate isomerase